MDTNDQNEKTFIGSAPAETGRSEAPGNFKQATLVIIEGPEIGREYRLHTQEMYIGRHKDVDIAVFDSKVSRRHAKLVHKADLNDGQEGFELIDLDSTNGTFLNGIKVNRPTLIREGDKLRVGNTILRFTFHDELDSAYHERLVNLLNFDNLTKLYTKRYFDHLFEQALIDAKKKQQPIAVLMMDLDHFKKVNDTHGHLMGSFVLSEVASVFRDKLRGQDIIGRYGGEEFVAFLPGLDRVGGFNVANRIREAVEAWPFTYEGVTIHITISIGVAFFPDDGILPTKLIKRADEALYRAKEEGRNRVILTEPRHP